MSSVLLGLILSGCAVQGNSNELAPMSEKVYFDVVEPSTKMKKEPGYGAAARAEAVGDAVHGGAPKVQEKRSVGRPAPAKPSSQEAAAVRQWFPEAFLWEPRISTNDDGIASVDVLIPDQLTSWRVLALAHDRTGHQSGIVHEFQGTLPAYIDPVVPSRMYVGDSLWMPLQVVNNQQPALSAGVQVWTEGAISGGLTGTVKVGAAGSRTERVELTGESAGTASLHAQLAGVDSVLKTWLVSPAGRPVSSQRGGTLTGERSLQLSWPADADPRTAALEVTIQPGPMAVLHTELERLRGGGWWTGAYAFGLIQHAGKPVDDADVRTLRIKAWQRVVREARNPSGLRAADLLAAMGPRDGDALADTLRDRLTRTVVSAQRGDGTWTRNAQSTLQRVLVETAVAAMALPASEAGPRLRASGALERHLPTVEDPYTAAVLLSTGLVSNRDFLKKIIVEGLVPVDASEPDGAKTIQVPSQTMNPWGRSPGRAEQLAWSALALHNAEPELAGDLVAELLTTYAPGDGFGEGQVDPWILKAIVEALPATTEPVNLGLEVDGVVVSTAQVDPTQPGLPVHLSGKPSKLSGSEVRLVAEPPTVGLSFVVSQQSWVPWTGSEALAGVELEVAQSPLRVGEEGSLTFAIAAPSGVSVEVTQGLPSGMKVVNEAELRANAGIESVDVTDDQVVLTTTELGAGEIRELSLKVVPTFAGQMITRPLRLRANQQEAMLAPHHWVVAL